MFLFLRVMLGVVNFRTDQRRLGSVRQSNSMLVIVDQRGSKFIIVSKCGSELVNVDPSG